MHQNREERDDDRDGERDPDAGNDAIVIDEHSAEKRRDHDGNALDHRLHANAGGMTIRGQRCADERERGRQRKTGPREEKEHARDDRAPMRNKEDERIADDGKNVESDEGMAMAPAIDEQAAGIGVDRAEEIPQRIEESDDENGRAERLEIFRQEAHPQFLAGADGEGGDEEDDEIALEPEKLSEALPSVHPRSETTMQARDKMIVAGVERGIRTSASTGPRQGSRLHAELPLRD